jgi:hypothetical protein
MHNDDFVTVFKAHGHPVNVGASLAGLNAVETLDCVCAYGKAGRVVAAVSFDQARWLEAYERLIEKATPFPLNQRGVDPPSSPAPAPAGFPESRSD